jgi:hypothetical protein
MKADARHFGGRLARVLAACFVTTMVFTAGPVGAQQTKLIMENYYFHGEPTDQVIKLVEDGPTFSQDAPEGDDPVVQVSSSLAPHPVGQALHSDEAHPLLAYWSGEFDGQLNGLLSLRVWVQGVPEPFARVRVYADGERLDVGPTTRNGESAADGLSAVLDVAPDSPRENVLVVAVSGTVDGSLTVELVGASTAVSGTSPVRDLAIWYASESHPSGLALPTIVPCEDDDQHPDCQ